MRGLNDADCAILTISHEFAKIQSGNSQASYGRSDSASLASCCSKIRSRESNKLIGNHPFVFYPVSVSCFRGCCLLSGREYLTCRELRDGIWRRRTRLDFASLENGKCGSTRREWREQLCGTAIIRDFSGAFGKYYCDRICSLLTCGSLLTLTVFCVPMSVWDGGKASDPASRLAAACTCCNI